MSSRLYLPIIQRLSRRWYTPGRWVTVPDTGRSEWLPSRDDQHQRSTRDYVDKCYYERIRKEREWKEQQRKDEIRRLRRAKSLQDLE